MIQTAKKLEVDESFVRLYPIKEKLVIDRHLSSKDYQKGRCGNVENYYHSSLYKFGIRVSAPSNHLINDESICLNGYCYLPEKNNKKTLHISNLELHDVSLKSEQYLVPYELSRHAEFKYSQTDSDYLSNQIRKLYSHIRLPFIFVGIAEVETNTYKELYNKKLSSNLSRNNHDPRREIIFDENIRSKLCMVGLVSDKTDSRLCSINRKLNKVLYEENTDKNSIPSTHIHGVLLNENIEKYNEILPIHVEKAMEIIDYATSVKYFSGEIYVINTIV
jgi:hypothetical protein